METRGGFYISQIKQLQDRIFERLLTECGIEISGGQGRILFVLWKQDHQSVGSISDQTALAKNTVSIVLDGMEKKGMVKRMINPNNRRQTIISLTEEAKAIQARYELVSKRMNTLFYYGFSEQERLAFDAYLERILHSLKQAEMQLEKGEHFDE